MGSNDAAGPPVPPRRSFGQRMRQAEAAAFSGTGLIPRIQHLRTQVWTWSCVRLGVAACATWLGWRYKNAGAGPLSLALSLLLFAFSLLVRTKHEVPR